MNNELQCIKSPFVFGDKTIMLHVQINSGNSLFFSTPPKTSHEPSKSHEMYPVVRGVAIHFTCHMDRQPDGGWDYSKTAPPSFTRASFFDDKPTTTGQEQAILSQFIEQLPQWLKENNDRIKAVSVYKTRQIDEDLQEKIASLQTEITLLQDQREKLRPQLIHHGLPMEFVHLINQIV